MYNVKKKVDNVNNVYEKWISCVHQKNVCDIFTFKKNSSHNSKAIFHTFKEMYVTLKNIHEFQKYVFDIF